MEEIKGSIESFDSILKNSFDKIQDIISSLDQFSKNMNQDIKNIVGKLQYYDITKQEIEHLSQFIRRIFEVFEDFKQEVDVEAELTHPEKEEIKRNLLKYINDMITTRNEREILEKYEEVFDITVSGEHKLETREHPEFSEEENIIVF
jgi:L-rhamnose mutarotase